MHVCALTNGNVPISYIMSTSNNGCSVCFEDVKKCITLNYSADCFLVVEVPPPHPPILVHVALGCCFALSISSRLNEKPRRREAVGKEVMGDTLGGSEHNTALKSPQQTQQRASPLEKKRPEGHQSLFLPPLTQGTAVRPAASVSSSRSSQGGRTCLLGS